MTQGSQDRAASLRRQTRQATIAIVAGFITWMGLAAAGGYFGWPTRFAILIDLAALACLGWALFVLINIRRARRRGEGD
ncbi:DUF5337 family protein [Pontivivens insulae]|uniref:DUF5337 domain-containing protein n=1 Tax=Pontivivens insulae TaxID=1639689 RepID=A0A2R8ACC0_9RHOB|nr:DUF5337 family protein [Pontivivens insulae]RED13793.1 hypothetical protein DFR53_1135 [Pontivivens insulae]SPF29867.1 hypothetical protein POI8812_02188 [Pontivivens insulae]